MKYQGDSCQKLSSGSWQAWTNSTTAQCTDIHCLHWWTTGPVTVKRQLKQNLYFDLPITNGIQLNDALPQNTVNL